MLGLGLEESGTGVFDGGSNRGTGIDGGGVIGGGRRFGSRG